MITELQPSTARFHRSSLSFFLAGVVAVLTFAPAAHASNIVADSGFESAVGGNTYFLGDTLDGGSWKVTLGSVYIDTQDPWVYNGNNSLNLTYSNLYTANSISETLNTMAGEQYTLSFWANSDTPNTFSVTENGLAIAGMPTSIVNNGFPNSTNSSLWVDYTGKFVATSATTALTFTSIANPAFGSQDGSVMIDDVSVMTPEPPSFVLMLSGIAAMGLIASRKRLESMVSAS